MIDSLRKLFMLLCSIFPLQNKIFVSSYFGGDYGDNAKYIVEELRRQNLDYQVVWLLKKSLMEHHHLPQGVKAVAYNSAASFFEMATAKVWINNSRFTTALRKRKGQLYIQTWHGGPGMKKVERDVEDALDVRYVHFAKKDSRMTDVYLSNSTFMTNLYANVFWYDGEIVECGSPRNDIFFGDTKKYADKIRAFYSTPADKKMVVYGPTFRKDHNLEVYSIDGEQCCRALSERFGGEWVLLMRLHPNLFELAEKMQTDGGRIINATQYPDPQELFAAADCLITDYSSLIVDYLPTQRPGFIFATDVDQYIDDRGFYFEFSDMPFPFSESNDRLIENILQFDEEKYRQDIAAFRKKTGLLERGVASKKAAEMIRSHMDNGR